MEGRSYNDLTRRRSVSAVSAASHNPSMATGNAPIAMNAAGRPALFGAPCGSCRDERRRSVAAGRKKPRKAPLANLLNFCALFSMSHSLAALKESLDGCACIGTGSPSGTVLPRAAEYQWLYARSPWSTTSRPSSSSSSSGRRPTKRSTSLKRRTETNADQASVNKTAFN